MFFFLALFFLSKITLANDSIAQFNNNSNKVIINKLQLADAIKTKAPKKFNVILTELKAELDTLTSEQYDEYTFLNAYQLTYTGQYNKAKILLLPLISSNSSNAILKFRATDLLIKVLAAKKEWSEGLEHITVNLKELPNIKSTKYYANSILTTIIFYNQIEQYDLAMLYTDKLTSVELTPSEKCLLGQLSLEVKFQLKLLKVGNKETDNAINICESAGFDIVTGIIRAINAKLYLENEMPEHSLSSLLPFNDDIYDTHYPMLIAGFNNIIAKSYWQLKEVDSAKKHALMALTSNQNITNLLQGIDTFKLLFQIAKIEKEYQLALEYHEQYSKLNKAHLDEIKVKNLAFQLAKHNAYEQESQIELLNEKNNSLAIEQALSKSKVANRQLIILILILFILVFSIIGIRFWRKHKRVKQLSEYDPLTGIFNRGHFTHIFDNALTYCESSKQDLSVIMFDLDLFKKINDRFGHACGDWALKETVKVCQNVGRQNDVFARLGGEEFCLVLPSCNIDVAMLRAEACRVAIEEIITEKSGNDFTITASFGVTDVKRSGFVLDKLLADADFATYASKNDGRNRVTLFELPQVDEPPKLDSSWDYN